MSSKDKTDLKVLIETNEADATATAAELVMSIICESVSRRGACHAALAGGTTPHALYQRLAATAASGEVPWGAVDIYFGDERDVPHDNVESNYHMAQQTLLDHVPISPDRVHAMSADVNDLPRSAAEYEQAIRRNVPADDGGLPSFDLILLGMGADGHTASLFPGTDYLDERKKLVVAGYVPVLGRHRMTFTFPLINAARNVVMLVTGSDKAEAVAALLSDEAARKAHIPAARVRPKGVYMLVLDAPAARLASVRT
jgi:6-phosphogluconolactonase